MADGRTPAARGAAVPPGSTPAAFHYGPGHLIMYGTEGFVARYGSTAVGQPACEAMVDMPRAAFELMTRVFREGRPLATTIHLPDGPRRLVVVPRRDPETGEVYGVTTHLRG